jgi:hypothetical protein
VKEKDAVVLRDSKMASFPVANQPGVPPLIGISFVIYHRVEVFRIVADHTTGTALKCHHLVEFAIIPGPKKQGARATLVE